MARGFGHRAGGIAGLVRLIDGHGGAIEYDLMTRAGATLDDIGVRIPWRAFAHFVGHLDASSAYVREISPDDAPWLGTERVQSMLADVIDLLNAIDWHLVSANSKRRPRKPKPYPRPWRKDEGTTIGRDPIPIKDFDRWWSGGDGDA